MESNINVPKGLTRKLVSAYLICSAMLHDAGTFVRASVIQNNIRELTMGMADGALEDATSSGFALPMSSLTN